VRVQVCRGECRGMWKGGGDMCAGVGRLVCVCIRMI
jgi:hypothetical protein